MLVGRPDSLEAIDAERDTREHADGDSGGDVGGEAIGYAVADAGGDV